MRRTIVVVVSLLLGIVVTAPAIGQSSIGGTDGSDDKVTGQAYVRHDGGTDAGIRHCNNNATDPAADDNLNDSDVDSNDGGTRRQANEPFSVVDPTDPDTVVAGWNDYCLTDLGAGWQGFAYSTDSGETWTDSLVPGYPQDTSEEGQNSPLFGDHTDAGDPIAAFDNDGNLFVGGIAFNRTGAVNGDVFVATYGTDPVGNYPVDYQRTRIVGEGTPTRGLGGGIFQDKPLLEVDRTGGQHDGNVYVCWSRFTGGGQNRILFSRSTDTGQTFSRPISLTTPGQIGSVQGCDIAVEADGDVYVTYRTFPIGSRRSAGLAFNRSTDGGASFGKAQLIRNITEYFPSDGARDCGDGPYVCPTEYVFHRVPLEPRVTSDQSGELPGVYLTYNEIRRSDSTVPSETSFTSAGAGRVGQSLVYVTGTTDDGKTWTDPVAVDDVPAGHQFFSDIDAFRGEMGVIWQDSRTDPAYSVQRPIGNAATSPPTSSPGTNEVNSFFAHSNDGASWSGSIQVSSVGHQSQYEMFGNRDIPFHGDYNWISLANTDPNDPNSPLLAYMSWTDNRDVVPGTDPREIEEQNGFDDGFDVLQCRVDLAENTQSRDDGPLARRDAPYTGDNCGNGGGLDQNIYGSSLLLP